MSEIAKRNDWFRTRVVPSGLAVALALGVSCAWGQDASSAAKKAAASQDDDLALEVFTSPDETLAPTPQQSGPPPLGLFPVFSGFPFAPRLGFMGPSTSPVSLRGPAELPFSNGIPIAAVSPLGSPIGGVGSLGGADEFSRSDSFDVMNQPSEFKYNGSEIGFLYAFSSKGASLRSAGFVTSMASNTTQIYVGANFTDQSGLTFPAGRYSPFGNSKFSTQTQQYFGGINYKLLGGAMVLGLDFAVADTKVNGTFRPINRANQALQSVVNPNDIGNPKTYSTQLNLAGPLPGNLGYQVGVGFDQNNLSGSDASSLQSLMTPRRR